MNQVPKDAIGRIAKPGTAVPLQHCGLYVAVFLDILGHRDKLRSLTAVRPSKPDCERLVSIAREVVFLRRDIVQYFEEVPETGDKLRERDPKLATAEGVTDGVSRIQVQPFADSVLITIAIVGSNRGLAPAADTWSALYASCQAVLLSMARGYVLRGGVELGLCVTLPDGGGLYGSAPLRAYELERTTAGYPRIVIGSHLVQYLTEIAKQPHVDEPSLAARRAATLAQGLLFVDSDGQTALDYLSPQFLDTVPDISEDLVRPAYEFVRREAERLASDPKLGARYRRLHAYFEERLTRRS